MERAMLNAQCWGGEVWSKCRRSSVKDLCGIYGRYGYMEVGIYGVLAKLWSWMVLGHGRCLNICASPPRFSP